MSFGNPHLGMPAPDPQSGHFQVSKAVRKQDSHMLHLVSESIEFIAEAPELSHSTCIKWLVGPEAHVQAGEGGKGCEWCNIGELKSSQLQVPTRL